MRIPTKQELDAVRNELKMHLDGVSRCTNILLAASEDMSERFHFLIETVIGGNPIAARPAIDPLVQPSLPSQELEATPRSAFYVSANGAIRKRSITSTLEPIVIDFINRLGKPASTAQLYMEARAKGIEIGGKHPPSNLGAHLSHSKLVKKTSEGWVVIPQQEKESAQ
jgi:hypothetical protein